MLLAVNLLKWNTWIQCSNFTNENHYSSNHLFIQKIFNIFFLLPRHLKRYKAASVTLITRGYFSTLQVIHSVQKSLQRLFPSYPCDTVTRARLSCLIQNSKSHSHGLITLYFPPVLTRARETDERWLVLPSRRFVSPLKASYDGRHQFMKMFGSWDSAPLFAGLAHSVLEMYIQNNTAAAQELLHAASSRPRAP